MAIEEHITDQTIQEVFAGQPVTLDVKSLSVTDQAGLICLVGLELEQQPKGSNKFISFLQNEFEPIMAVYGYYWSVDRKMLKLSSRNFQSTMLFEQEFNYLIKHLTPERTQALFSSVQDGVNLTKVELELTSIFDIQPEDEIGTGTWEYVEPEPVDDTTQPVTTTQTATNGTTIKIPLKDILDQAAKKVLGVGVKKTADEKDQEQDSRDAYYVYTQYLYQFTDLYDYADLPTIAVASRKFWEENGHLDDQNISEYLEDLIPDWADNWFEEMEGVFTYIGGKITKTEAIAYLQATGLFKHEIIVEDTQATVLMNYLEGQSDEVRSKFLKAAISKLDEDAIEELLKMYEAGFYEDE